MKGQIRIKPVYPTKEQRTVVISYGDAKVSVVIDIDSSPQSLKKMSDLIVVFDKAKKYISDIKTEVESNPKYKKEIELIIE